MAEQTERSFRTRDFELSPWQQEAVRAWSNGDARGSFRGTLEIFTGGGKTLIALACMERAAAEAPDAKFAVVVPTEALARQWIDSIATYTKLDRHQIGLLGAGKKDELTTKTALVSVINSASRHLPRMMGNLENAMLVVDECHRAGAPTFSKVLEAKAQFRLGLSATPERDEFDEHGEPLTFDEQIVGRLLGEVVYRFDLRQAREAGWLPEYAIHHHGVSLLPEEERTYKDISRRVDDAADKLRALGIDTIRARQVATGTGPEARLAGSYVALTARRKDLLYKAAERHRVASAIVRRALSEHRTPRILLFHERVREAVSLYETLVEEGSGNDVELEHSELPNKARTEALERFRSGEARILVSVRSLIEGIDVPEADVGVSIASSSSVRQRVQSLGRVLRRLPEGAGKRAEMHIIYVAGTVDEVIYGKENWSDLTGEAQNNYWLWQHESEQPLEQGGPPREPLPTEEEEWARLGAEIRQPQPWFGAWPDHEYSVDTHGTVTNAQGSVIANSQHVAEMIEGVRRRPGGRFWVTPRHRYVLVQKDSEGLHVAGRLAEPFQVREEGASLVSVEELSSGGTYPGPTEESGGTYRLRQTKGGVIERKTSARSKEFALTEGSGDTGKEANARRLLDAWRGLAIGGLEFYVNALGHAWFRLEGVPKFLADVKDGFRWPSKEG